MVGGLVLGRVGRFGVRWTCPIIWFDVILKSFVIVGRRIFLVVVVIVCFVYEGFGYCANFWENLVFGCVMRESRLFLLIEY